MVTTISTKFHLNFSNPNNKPKTNTKPKLRVFNMVYNVNEINLNETLESPMSPAEASEQGKMEDTNTESGILMELTKCLKDDLLFNDIPMDGGEEEFGDETVMVGLVEGLLVGTTSTSGLNFGLQYKSAVERTNKQN